MGRHMDVLSTLKLQSESRVSNCLGEPRKPLQRSCCVDGQICQVGKLMVPAGEMTGHRPSKGGGAGEGGSLFQLL